jgi:hypothetical protein
MAMRQFTLRRLLLWMAIATVPLAAVGYCLRWLGEGERAVARARVKVAQLGGTFRVGPSSGSYYVSLVKRPLTDEALADLAIDLRAMPAQEDEDDERRVNLTLAGTQVTDAGLESLVGIHFGQLNLPPGTTDAAIPTLKKLSLEGLLIIAGTQISDAGQAELKEAFPRSSVLRRDPLQPRPVPP